MALWRNLRLGQSGGDTAVTAGIGLGGIAEPDDVFGSSLFVASDAAPSQTVALVASVGARS
jgi:hypothetical protein